VPVVVSMPAPPSPDPALSEPPCSCWLPLVESPADGLPSVPSPSPCWLPLADWLPG
jgi:hypothetical protein